MLKTVVVVAVALPVLIVVVRWIGSARWAAGTRVLRDELEAARVAAEPAVVGFAELDGLPEPVQRFFRAVLTEGRPIFTDVHLRHVGTLNMSEGGEQWCAFTSDQLVVLRRPGFDWDACITMLPGVPVGVHDAYIAGEGVLQASLFRAFTLAKIRGGGDIASGELLRFFAEAAWYPTALLPSQGVRWTAIDERSASAAMSDGSLSVNLRPRGQSRTGAVT